MKHVVLLEANEIPVRLIEDHVRRRPNGALAKLLSHARTYITQCEDELELDPWISWPTLHRGVSDRDHKIHHLGQSLDWADRKFPPLWRLLQQAGVDVGVFGSLHSSHVPENAQDYAFYVPDYFAAEAYAHPPSMKPFQEFNLVMTRRSARNVDPGLPLKEAAKFGASALTNGLSADTITQIAAQLATERVKPLKKIRRRNMQAVIGFDLFLSLLDKKRPQFSTFYTNHVAAAMHRYWAAHFTEDNETENAMPADWIERYKEEVPAAMDAFDGMLGKLMRHAEKRGATLVIASSLGQAAVDAHETRGFTTVTDTAKLMSFLGLEPGDWRPGHAMVPCVSVELNPDKVDAVATRLEQLEFMGARPIRSENEVGPLSFDIKNDRSLHLYFYNEGVEPEGEVRLGNRAAAPEEAGFGFFIHEDNVACSAHHIAEGFLAIYEPGAAAEGNRWSKLSTRAVAPAILRNFNIAPPAYMIQEPGLAI